MTGQMRPIQVRTGRHPFEVLLLVAAALVGVILLVGDASPKSVSTTMPVGVRIAWELALLLGGLTALAGVFGPMRLVSQLCVELAGMFILGAGMAMYTAAMFIVNGQAAIAAGAFVGAFGGACWWRLTQIMRDLSRMVRATIAGDVRNVPLLVERMNS